MTHWAALSVTCSVFLWTTAQPRDCEGCDKSYFKQKQSLGPKTAMTFSNASNDNANPNVIAIVKYMKLLTNDNQCRKHYNERCQTLHQNFEYLSF